MGMMAAAFLDQHRNPAAKLVINAFDGQRKPAQEGIDAAAHVQQRHIVGCQGREPRQDLPIAARIVGIDAGNLVRMRRSPGIGVFAAPAHADKGRLRRKPVLPGEKLIPGIPLSARLQVLAGFDVTDMKPAPE